MRFLDAMRRDPRVTDFHYRVGAEIMSFCNLKSGLAWPSHQTMANNLRASVSGVLKAVTALVDLGYFHLERGRGRGHSNRYFPNINADGRAPFVSENVDGQVPFNPEKVDGQATKRGPSGMEKVPGSPHELLDEHLEEPSAGRSPASAPEGAPSISSAGRDPALAATMRAFVADLGKVAGLPENAERYLADRLVLVGVRDGVATVTAPPAEIEGVRHAYGTLLSQQCRRLGAEKLELVAA